MRVTITKNCAEQYYASVMFKDDKAIGLDLGLTHFGITSDSQKLANPRWFKKHECNLQAKQQQLSRKQKGSNNRNKSRLKVAKVHHKITRCRSDFRDSAMAKNSERESSFSA